ncbi:MAG: site-specific integrase, partial [bacterium]|nr:site-specific integrase [bacterium]
MASIAKRTTNSGQPKYDVRYRDPTGRQRKKTFSRRGDADRFARTVEVEKETGRYVDPTAGKVTFAQYSERWLGQRPNLRPRTREFYSGLLRNHLLPTFGETELSKVAPALVREWWARLNAGPLSASSCAKAYRLLRTILSTAEQDELIPRNPCRIAGAGVERAGERPVATAPQVHDLAAAMPNRLGCAVLIMGFAGLRLGETLGLERLHVNGLHRELIVEQQLQELSGGIIVMAEPKTDAGKRRLHLPSPLLAAIQEHLDEFVEAVPSSRLFNTASGLPVRRGQWHRD